MTGIKRSKSTVRTKSVRSRAWTVERLIALIEKHCGLPSLTLAAHTKEPGQGMLLQKDEFGHTIEAQQ